MEFHGIPWSYFTWAACISLLDLVYIRNFIHNLKMNLRDCSDLEFTNLKELSWGFSHFGAKNVLKFKLNAFSRTENTPRTSREGNQMMFW